MKKFTVLLAAVLLVLSFAACGSSDTDVKSEGVMTYAEYMAAEMNTQAP